MTRRAAVPALSPRCLARLATVDPSLAHLVQTVSRRVPLLVIEGHRSAERQAELLAAGRSKTANSKHLPRPSRAVDLAPAPIDWGEAGTTRERHQALARFYLLGGYLLALAEAQGLRVRWGGDWDGDFDPRDQTFDDLVHFELED